MFRNLSIKAKIAGLVIPLLLLLFITSGFAIQQMRLIGEELKTVQTEDIPLVRLIADITVKQLEKSAAIEKALRVSNITAADEALPAINQHIIDLAKDIDHEIKAGEKILAVAKTHALTPAIEQELILLEQALLKVDKEHLTYEHNVESLMQRIQQGETISSHEIIALESTQKKIEKELQSLLIGVETMTEHTLDKVSEDEANALWGMIIISIIAITTGMLLGILITRAISKPLAQAVEITEQLAAGDLSVEITSNSSDETGRLLQSMQIMSQRLHDMVSQIAAASEQLSSATDEVASVSTQIAGNIDTQTNHLNRTATAMHEMSATVRDIASNAEEAAASTQEADNEALSGTRLVSQVNASIQDLAGRIETSKDSIAQLDHQAKQVDQILEVITSIAAQTNLLALNAAIEAARAGTSGRGFAVVADEVRSLASRTQDSVSSIQEMVGDLQAGTENSVAVMQEGFRQAGDTVGLSRDAANNLTEISQAVNSISSMNLQIASATQQQSIVADEVNDSLEFLNNSALEVNSGARQMAQASEEIAQLSNSLRSLIQQFKLA